MTQTHIPLKYGYLIDDILKAGAESSRYRWMKQIDARMLCRMAERRISVAHLGEKQEQSIRRLIRNGLCRHDGAGAYTLTADGWELVHEAHTPAVA